MENEHIEKKVNSIGARIKFSTLNKRSNTSLLINVLNDKYGEYFDIATQPDNAPELKILQVKPKDRHMLLYATDGQRFLMGHDERHWFVAGIEENVSTVIDAKKSLIPNELREQINEYTVKKYDNRKNKKFIRQGEWFFVPTKKKIPEGCVHFNEAIRRRFGKAHICQFLYREDGELVYIYKDKEYTEQELKKFKQDNPNIDLNNIETRMRNPKVYVRGYVVHPDHSKILLNGWHRVYLNNESASISVGFLD